MENLTFVLGGVPRSLSGPLPRLAYAGWMPPHSSLKAPVTSETLDFGLNFHPANAGAYRLIVDGTPHESPFPSANIRIPGPVYQVAGEGTFETLYFCYEATKQGYFAAACPGGTLPMGPWSLRHAWEFESAVQNILELMRNAHYRGGADRLDAAALNLIAEMLLCRFTPESQNQAERDTIRRIAAQLGRRSLDPLIREAGLSRSSFFRKWALYYRESPHEYVMARRLERAARLLAEGQSVKEVARELGFSSAFHLSRSFKQRYGVPPSRHAQVTPAHG